MVAKASLMVEPEFDGTYNVVIKKYNNEVTIDIPGIGTNSCAVNGMIDYTKALMWCGTATGLPNEDGETPQVFQCVYTGDISLLHIQEASMSENDIKLAFNDYEQFKDNGFDTKGDAIYISTNFEETTPLKARDYSGNGMHLLKYDYRWIS